MVADPAPPEAQTLPPTPVDPNAALDWAKLRPRVAPVQAALTRALAKAARAPSGSDAWASAQVELSRAEQLSGDLEDLATRFGATFDHPAGPADLAAARGDVTRRLAAAKAAPAR